MNSPSEYTYMNKVVHSYGSVRVLDGFDLSLPTGKITAVIGPSGCGKTTLLNLMADLIQPEKGIVDTSHEKVGYIFQEDRLLPWETVYNNIRLVRPIESREEIMKLLQALQLEDFADSYPGQLSGGMRQRCALARGFYYNATLLLMDEPFKSLDYDLRLNLVAYLGKLWTARENTILFVTHDIDEALLLGHKILVLSARPTRIIAEYQLVTPVLKRSIRDEEHLEIHKSIIGHLAR